MYKINSMKKYFINLYLDIFGYKYITIEEVYNFHRVGIYTFLGRLYPNMYDPIVAKDFDKVGILCTNNIEVEALVKAIQDNIKGTKKVHNINKK